MQDKRIIYKLLHLIYSLNLQKKIKLQNNTVWIKYPKYIYIFFFFLHEENIASLNQFNQKLNLDVAKDLKFN